MKKRIWKRLVCFLAAALLLIPFFIPATGAEPPGGDFKGTRSLVCTIDQSDLNNYINGGRSAFDLLLRINKPPWLSASLSTAGRDVELSLSFSFESFPDYEEKLTALMLYEPIYQYDQGDSLSYKEYFSSLELLNCFFGTLSDDGFMDEFSKDELFLVKHSVFVLNGATYESKDHVNTREEAERYAPADFISIHTAGKGKGSYLRSIHAGIKKSQRDEEEIAAFQEQWRKQMSYLAKPVVSDENGTIDISVEFSAGTKSELMQSTSIALNANNTIKEKESFVSEAAVGVEYTEKFDLKNVLKTENGSFSYEFECPDFVKALAPIDGAEEDTKVDDQTVSHTGKRTAVSFRYERGFQFSSVEVTTDLTNPFGKVRREVVLEAPKDIAQRYHESIKTNLQAIMIDGTTLDIVDKGNLRRYKLSYQAWFPRDIEKFTQSVFKGAYSLKLDRPVFPFQTGEIADQLSLQINLPNVVVPASGKASYVLPEHAAIKENEEIQTGAITVEQNRCTQSSKQPSIQFLYSSVNWIYFGAVCVLALLLTGILILLIFKLRKKVIRYREKKANSRKRQTQACNRLPEHSGNEGGYLCPSCHRAYQEMVNFCEDCGCAVVKREEEEQLANRP